MDDVRFCFKESICYDLDRCVITISVKDITEKEMAGVQSFFDKAFAAIMKKHFGSKRS